MASRAFQFKQLQKTAKIGVTFSHHILYCFGYSQKHKTVTFIQQDKTILHTHKRTQLLLY